MWPNITLGVIIIPYRLHPLKANTRRGYMTAKATNQFERLRVLLPVGKEKSPIEVLRSNNSQTLCYPQCNPVFAEEHKKFLAEQECLQKIVADLLGDKKNLVDDLTDAVLAVSSIENRMIYRQGVRDGFLLAIELFGGGV